MDATRMREILRLEYGIKSDEEFLRAYDEMVGIDIGLFTSPLERGKSDKDYETVA